MKYPNNIKPRVTVVENISVVELKRLVRQADDWMISQLDHISEMDPCVDSVIHCNYNQILQYKSDLT